MTIPALPQTSLGTRLSVQFHVIVALMIRNIMARYGRGNLGFLWLIAEPMCLVGGVILMWSFLYPGGKQGIAIAAFVLASYMPLTLWRHLSSLPRLMSANFGLLYHRRVSVFDIIVARALTDLVSISAAGLIVYFLLLSVGLVDWIEDASLVLLGWAMMAWFAFGVGCLIAGLSEKSDVLENLIQPVQYLLLPISGVFFMVSWLPKSARDYVLLVPQVHIYEMVRAGVFGRAVETYYAIGYVALWSTLLTMLGIWAMASSRARLTFR